MTKEKNFSSFRILKAFCTSKLLAVEEIGKRNYIKLDSLYSSKDSIKRVRREPGVEAQAGIPELGVSGQSELGSEILP